MFWSVSSEEYIKSIEQESTNNKEKQLAIKKYSDW